MALKISKELKEKMRLAVTSITTDPDVFWWAMEIHHKENRLSALLAKDQDYNEELCEEMNKLREKYAQKYIDEGLL